MTRYMLDTNTASHVIRGERPEVVSRLRSLPIQDVSISVVTEAELLFGLAKRGFPKILTERVRQFLIRVDVVPWARDAVQAYSEFRASCERAGTPLAPLDMMIAAHAISCDAILVTQDKAFTGAPPPLRKESWTNPAD